MFLGINIVIFACCFVRMCKLINIKPDSETAGILCRGIIAYLFYTVVQVGITLIIQNL